MTRNGKRGRLLDIESLPESATGLLDHAADRVVRKMGSQLAIRDELNAALAARGLPGASKSAFNRWCTRLLTEGYARRSRAAPAPASAGVVCPHCGGALVVAIGRPA